MSTVFRFATARELFEAFPTARSDMAAGPTDEAAVAFALALRESRTPEDAITFCAYLLDHRSAVWWAHECVRAVVDEMADDDAALMALAKDWVRDPHEEPRRMALLAAGGRARTPAAWVALAAGWSHDFDPASSNTLPPVGLTPKAVNSAVLGALARVPREHRKATLDMFLDMGLNLPATQGRPAATAAARADEPRPDGSDGAVR